MSQRTVLITGCSDGGLGASLAIALHKSGWRVIATARNLNKLSEMVAAGIETLSLDVLDENSIAECVSNFKKLTPSLDMLVNNAGAVSNGALTDISIPEARALFDLNVWAPVAMIQAFMPLLVQSSNPVIVNHTSVASVVALPFGSVYAASKAAIAALTYGLRGELSSFEFKVVDIKSGNVESKISANTTSATEVPSNSLFYPARAWLNKFISGEHFAEATIPAEQWAKYVASKLSQSSPPGTIWYGGNASLAYWMLNYAPRFMVDRVLNDTAGVPKVQKAIKDYGREKAIANAYGQK